MRGRFGREEGAFGCAADVGPCSGGGGCASSLTASTAAHDPWRLGLDEAAAGLDDEEKYEVSPGEWDVYPLAMEERIAAAPRANCFTPCSVATLPTMGRRCSRQGPAHAAVQKRWLRLSGVRELTVDDGRMTRDGGRACCPQNSDCRVQCPPSPLTHTPRPGEEPGTALVCLQQQLHTHTDQITIPIWLNSLSHLGRAPSACCLCFLPRPLCLLAYLHTHPSPLTNLMSVAKKARLT